MKQLKISILLIIIFTVMTGGIYPLIVTGIGTAFFKEKINGSLIVKNGTIAGSDLIGQQFKKPEFFHGRPSAVNYDASGSGGSNFGPTNKKFIDDVHNRAIQIRTNFNLSDNASITSDLIFASGSGLDPHISKESAILQIDRIAAARKINKSIIEKIIEANCIKHYYIFGHSYVNVLKLNLDLIDNGNLK